MPRRKMTADVIRLKRNPGNLSKAEIADREVLRPTLVSGNPPEGLTRDELACWQAHAPELVHMGLLTVVSRDAFWFTVCLPYAIVLEARRQLRPRRKDGQPDGRRQGLDLVVDDPAHGGQRRNPALLVLRQGLADYRAGCKLFGLTPLDLMPLRPWLPIAEDSDDEDDSAFFGTGLGDAG